MKETTYKLRTLNEIIQTFPDSHISQDPNDSDMVYLHVCFGHCSNTRTYGLSRFCINTYIGHTVCLRIHYDCFHIIRFDEDGHTHAWIWNLSRLDDFIEIFCKTTNKRMLRTCQSGLAAILEG